MQTATVQEEDDAEAGEEPTGEETASNTQWVNSQDCCGSPRSFSGREDEWHDWSLKFGATSNVVPRDADALHREGGKGKKGMAKGKFRGDKNKHDTKGKGKQSGK